jgi:hypothetical protein
MRTRRLARTREISKVAHRSLHTARAQRICNDGEDLDSARRGPEIYKLTWKRDQEIIKQGKHENGKD